VVLEHFNFEMQPLLDAYMQAGLSFDELVAAYQAQGTEAHDVMQYAPLLQLARAHAAGGRAKLVAGFLPKPLAQAVLAIGLGAAIAEAVSAGYLPEGETCESTDEHYNFFESLVTGRDSTTPRCSPQASHAGSSRRRSSSRAQWRIV